ILVFYNKLLPDHKEVGYNERYDIAQYLSEIVVSDKSKLIGQIAFRSDLAKEDVRILKIIRENDDFIPNSTTRIEANDILIVECSVENLIKIKESEELDVLADTIGDKEIKGKKILLAELLIMPGSSLINRTLKESRFRQNYDLVAV